MKFFRFVLTLATTITLLYLLDNRWTIDGSPLPPLGKFLDPFHGFWQNAEDGKLPFSAEINLPGLHDKVLVQYDSNQVPHIFATNDRDLYYVQGYVIAQHRLWQMEFQTHAAAGRISEIIGEATRDFDRLQRRKGMLIGARASHQVMQDNETLYDLLSAYADGVNAYIQSLDNKDLPIEYKLLDYQPEEWTTLKSALILEYMTDNLTGWDNDLENTNALEVWDKATFDFLFPNHLRDIDPVVPTEQWDFEPLTVSPPDTTYTYIKSHSVIEKPDPDNGSNNWAVSGSKTQSGYPILANDPHLGLHAPSLWILLQLQSPNVNVYGFTFTGALGVTIGFNDSTAWGFTDVAVDERDWYQIHFENEDRDAYLFNGSWQKAEKVIEEIKIRNGESFYDTIIHTRHGPVVYDRNFLGQGDLQNFALKWTGHYPSEVQEALLMLNRTKNYEDYLQATEYWDCPAQQIVFASHGGDIALQVRGDLPLKWPEQGKFLLDGSNPQHEWQAFIPKAHNPFQHNPERGFVSSANQHPVDSLYPYYFNVTNGVEFYRNRRINQLLAPMQNITPQDFMQMQMDNYNIKAEEVLPLLLDSLTHDTLNEQQKVAREELMNWNYHFDPEIKAPSYFSAWFRHLKNLLWDEFDREDMALDLPNEYNSIKILKRHPSNPFIDIQYTPEKETLTDLINLAFSAALEDLESWKQKNQLDYNWGNYKGTSVIHLARIPAFGQYNIQIGGNGDAINATQYNHGPSLRMIVELTSPPKAWGIYPGGQSGNPGSPYYDNQIAYWRNGEYFPLYLMQETVDKEMVVLEQNFIPVK